MKSLILGGPYTGKTTAHNRKQGFDVESDPIYIHAKAENKRKGGKSRDIWPLYEELRSRWIQSEEDVVFAHFAEDAWTDGLRAGRVVKLVIPPADELERRMLVDGNLERAGAAMHQLRNTIAWMTTSGKWLDPRIYDSIDAALS